MEYDYGAIAPSTTKVLRKSKLYTDDGSTEIYFSNNNNDIKIITYIGGDAYSAVAFNQKKIESGSTTEAKYYLHRDYLGSILAISNSNGDMMEYRHFDAWGNLSKIIGYGGIVMDPANGLQFLDRGYTGHEHLQEVRLIHMNGRLYDPMLRSFLMPDNFVRQPENTQNYNRYAYCLNNPLMYNDPSGEDYVLAVAIGVAVAIVAYLVTNYVTDQTINCSGILKSGIMGAVSSIATFGIGSAATAMFSNFYSVAAAQAVGHGMFQGAMSSVTGGSFWSGFAAGAISSIASSVWSGGETTTTKFESNSGLTEGHFVTETITHEGIGFGGKAGMIAFGTVMGGVGAELAGGNFWVGAAAGLFVSGLNHAMHEMGNDGETEDPPKYKYKDKIYDDKAKLYGDILIDQAAEQFGIKDILALGAAVDNLGYLDKPFVTPGASSGTSLASKYGSKILPQQMPRRMFTHFNKAGKAVFTKTLGRFLGRALGPIGWAMLAYDVGMTLYNTQQIYDKIVQ
jgi:RHS repeat-associated protein